MTIAGERKIERHFLKSICSGILIISQWEVGLVVVLIVVLWRVWFCVCVCSAGLQLRCF